MATRKRVALIYAYDEGWIGGTYYIENLISALAQLPDDQQPELLIFSSSEEDAKRLQKAIQYPYWLFRRFERTLSLPAKVLNKITATLLSKRYISMWYNDADLVFPMLNAWKLSLSRIPNHVYWIPDFQEHYLPEFFTQEEIKTRKADQQLIQQVARHIVFSSFAAQDDFNTIYPKNSLNQHVLQFAVTRRPSAEQPADCLVKYDISQPYFICSNQFWKHKDHPTVLRAVANLRRTYPQALVIFTGKESDYRHPTYFAELMSMQEELGLSERVRFLGFIPREDQVALMQKSVAIIQPSLFEGWSTVVEDAKSLGLPLIVSEISVHKEQLVNYGAKLFFTPENEMELSDCMAQLLNSNLPNQHNNYQEDIIRFAQNFVRIVEKVTTN